MRYPVEQKAETHERIIEAAARAFRERGSEGQGIASLMNELGLTHGGFYKHFGGKEDLYVEAVTRGLRQTGDRMIAAAEAAPKGRKLRAIIERYLSVEHLEHGGNGCVLATLAPEISRQPEPVRARINAATEAYMRRLLPFLPGSNLVQKRQQFLLLFPAMAGVLMTARLLTDPALREETLAAARQFYTKAFAEKGAA
jgi:TetR/AcrR family transcriptional repressor of nem operon